MFLMGVVSSAAKIGDSFLTEKVFIAPETSYCKKGDNVNVCGQVLSSDYTDFYPYSRYLYLELINSENEVCSRQKIRINDNGSEFCAHKLISKALAPKGSKNPNLVFFADSYSSWQKGAIENANKLIRQYIPKGTDFSSLTDAFILKIQHKINRRPRKKLNFRSPCEVFFEQITNFALAS